MTQQIYPAMAKIMREATHIGKDQKNAQQGFKYRGIDDVYNSLHKVFADNGVFVTPEVLEKTREERTNKNGTVLAFTCLRMKYTFWAEDGSSVSCIVEGEGMDSGDKSSNKAMAVGHKYALLQTFMIPTDEVKDPDAESHELGAGASQHRFKPGEKDEIYKQVRECLEAGDDHGLREILHPYQGDADAKMKVWALFNSSERDSITKLLGEKQ